MHYVRSGHFIIHLMALWWVWWLIAAMTPINSYLAPSWEVTAQFAAFIVFFMIGHALVNLLDPRPGFKAVGGLPATFALRRSLHVLNFTCLLVLLASLYKSGAFSEEFVEYFLKLRKDELRDDSLTGSRLLDTLTKVVIFPISYTLTTVVLATRAARYRWILLTAIINILLFSYLWQVNYSLIHLFWFFVLYVLIGIANGSSPNRTTLTFLAVLLALLVAAAANRFGGDITGALQRYMLGYHTAGFALYDYYFQRPDSVLHDHSFGRSSLGVLEQYLEIIARRLDLAYVAASSENAANNIDSIDIGATETIVGNAFGTFLFGFYRDFNVVGVALGGLMYGGFTSYLLARSRQRWTCAAAFYVLGSAWMVGMMVNPIEQPHFWFSILLIGALSSINRGWKR